MIRRDYEKIAAVFSDTKKTYQGGSIWIEGGEQIHHTLVHNTADTLAQGNPHFNREHFLKACGIEA